MPQPGHRYRSVPVPMLVPVPPVPVPVPPVPVPVPPVPVPVLLVVRRPVVLPTVRCVRVAMEWLVSATAWLLLLLLLRLRERWALGWPSSASSEVATECVSTVPPSVELPPSAVLEPTLPADGLAPESMLDHTADSLAAAVRRRLGRGDALARAMYRAYHRNELSASSVPPELLAATTLGSAVLGLCRTVTPLEIAGPLPARPPRPGCTEKYVLRACTSRDEVEMVAMPAPGMSQMRDDAWSLCISSQVGCRMGCAFCETGRMGLLRNLSAGEIVAQVALARRQLGLRVANVVFMGMGEPLDNVEEVIQAVRVLTDPAGLALPLSHITISTSGEAHHVFTLLEALPAVRLAFSIHAANESLRSRLMPINRRVPLGTLAEAMRTYVRHTKRRVTIQYVLLAGVNDVLPTHADELVTFLGAVGPLGRLHVNLIPYNQQSGKPRFASPTHAEALAFKTALQARGLFVKIRSERGSEKMAACGQLGNVRLRRDLDRARRKEGQEGTAAQAGAATHAGAVVQDAEEAAEAVAMDAVVAAERLQQQLRPVAPGGAAESEPVGLCGRKELEW